LGQENSQRLLLKEGAITSIPRSLCNNAGAKNVILVIGDGMGWEMTRAGSIAKQVVAELKGYGCDIINGCPNNTAASAAFAGRTVSSYYAEGKRPLSNTSPNLSLCLNMHLLTFV
jgi:alkaline phosphatase